MIPIRNFPYSDYHDLNLDWLLRRIYQFEVDLEDLKRRVRRLEDWREEAEPTITDLVSRMLIVEGNIVTINREITTINNTIDDHSRRITTVEGDIVTILDNSTSFYIDERDLTTVYSNYIGGPSFPLNIDFINKLKGNPPPAKGGINYEIFVISGNGSILNKASYRIEQSDFIIEYSLHGVKTDRLASEDLTKIVYIFLGGTLSNTFIYKGSGSHVKSYLDVEVPSSGWVANNDPTYVYKNVISNQSITANTEVRAYFDSFADHELYSDVISDYILTANGEMTLFAKEAINTDFNINLFVNNF